MKDIFYKKLIVLILIFSVGFTIKAQENVSKIIEETYEFTNAGELQLKNKYGNINIHGWDEDKIQIKITVLVNKKDKKDADGLLKRIKPSISYSKEFINIFSYIEEKESGLFSKMLNRANPFDFDKGNIQIDYDISLPVNAALQVTNKFGDIVTNDWRGTLKASIEHGDLWVNDTLTNATIEMKFGKLKTKSIAYSSIKLKNSEFEMEESKDLRINTSGSTISINKVSNLEIYASKDKINIQNIDRIQGEFKFSNVIVNKIKEYIHLTMNVTDLRINKITKPDAVINLKQKSSEVNINVSGLRFDFSASLEQGLLRIPKSFTEINTIVIDQSKRLRDITASYGNGTKGTFKIEGIKGVIILTEK